MRTVFIVKPIVFPEPSACSLPDRRDSGNVIDTTWHDLTSQGGGGGGGVSTPRKFGGGARPASQNPYLNL